MRDIPHRAPADPEAADLFARLHESEPDGGSDSDTDIDLYGGDEVAVQHSDPGDVVLVSQGAPADQHQLGTRSASTRDPMHVCQRCWPA